MNSTMRISSNNQLSQSLLEAIKRKKFSSCIQELNNLAEQGNCSALIALSHIFFHGGGGIRKDYKAALGWLNKIKPEDDVTGYAAYRLGIIYYKGLGLVPRRRLAFKYFRNAALHGSHMGLFMVAVMQKRGNETLKKTHASKIIFGSIFRNRKLGFVIRMLAFRWFWSF